MQTLQSSALIAGPYLMLHCLASNWWLVLLRGFWFILFGVIAFLWPVATLFTLVVSYAAFAMVDGVLAMITAVMGGTSAPRWWLAIAGLFSIAAGLTALFWPGVTARGLLLIIAGWAIATGILQIAGAMELRQELDNEWLLATGGALSIILGSVLFLKLALGALAVIFVMRGYAVLHGFLLLWLSLRLRAHA
jgi:uncharacterized membrane protein HdeD (DUF308 family)